MLANTNSAKLSANTMDRPTTRPGATQGRITRLVMTRSLAPTRCPASSNSSTGSARRLFLSGKYSNGNARGR